MNKSLILLSIIAAVVLGYAAVMLTSINSHTAPKPATFGSVEDLFSGGGTHASTTVNTTSTQVLPGTWKTFAEISNTTGNIISCWMDNATQASSSVAVNSGILLYPTSTGAGMVCFGRGQTCIPYIGAVNCIAGSASVVATYRQ